MPKAYWIAHVTVKDPEKYKEYVSLNAIPFKKYKAKFLARGGKYEIRKGADRERHVILEFESYEVAKACYDSPEYKAAETVRDQAADVEVLILDGYDGPQPGQS